MIPQLFPAHQRAPNQMPNNLSPLVYVPNVPSLSPSTNSSSEISQDAVPVVIDTVYWGVSQSPNSLFFNVTNRKESERTLYEFAFYQFQDFIGQLVHRSGANCYLEINFDDEENKNEAIAKSLQFDNGHIIIRPAVGLTSDSIIKKINLQRLPWLRPKKLLAGLTATLSNYGVIRDAGIIRDADTSTFLGSGYATLEITPTLVSEGHNVAARPASPSSRLVCYRCLERGHLRADCLLKKAGLKRSHQGKPVAKNVSPLFPQPNIKSTAAAVPMTRESLHPDPTAIDATGGPSALSISSQSALISSAQSKYAPTSAAFSDSKIDITTADDLATSMECDEPFSFDGSPMDSSPASADDSTRIVVVNTSSLFKQEDVPQEVPQRNDDRNEELSRILDEPRVSIRSRTSSAALDKGVDLQDIVALGNWASSETFRAHHQRHHMATVNFASMVLDHADDEKDIFYDAE
ncbi:hypothetical protein G6F36_012762 [Rhizopus arrhizus]|nr:hypothetical protein G6F36_012762 [Rhizopus arrhizus]